MTVLQTAYHRLNSLGASYVAEMASGNQLHASAYYNEYKKGLV